MEIILELIGCAVLFYALVVFDAALDKKREVYMKNNDNPWGYDEGGEG